MDPTLFTLGGDDTTVGGKSLHSGNGGFPLFHDPSAVVMQHIVPPVRRQTFHQGDAEYFLIAGIGIDTTAFGIDFKDTEMNGFGNQAKALFALFQRFLSAACLFLFVFELLDTFYQLDDGGPIRHSH